MRLKFLISEGMVSMLVWCISVGSVVFGSGLVCSMVWLGFLVRFSALSWVC